MITYTSARIYISRGGATSYSSKQARPRLPDGSSAYLRASDLIVSLDAQLWRSKYSSFSFNGSFTLLVLAVPGEERVAHCWHSQGTQSRSLAVSNATKYSAPGVPISIYA